MGVRVRTLQIMKKWTGLGNMENVDNKDEMNEVDKMGDNEDVGIGVRKEVEKEEEGMRMTRRSRLWSCHPIAMKTMVSCLRPLESMQRRKIISVN